MRAASIADVIEDPALSAMLAALAGGRALPAGELARLAGVQPEAAPMYLRRLTDAGLIKVRVRGRHRYHEIVSPEVAIVLEAIAEIAPPAPVPSLSEARTCYDHLAGRLGVELRDRLLGVGAIRGLDDRDHELTDRGQDLLGRLGIELAVLRASRRVFARSCVDWTDRRVHLAGALPAAITSVFLDRGWLARGPGRALRVDDAFDDNIEKWLVP
ncbi:winged helix-turn-helix domain-containing protein [Mycobacterium cookii]|uniref:Putative HTH-type transcriptional regulator YdfF n=1 Tax=Mycobacterium cookii TaxID=1775 RepID=A0A7I7L1D6_9MYCO|nr:helix-turn-helix domain-containing protein [Mycobacterium cookii]MCV7329743.1 helix-turn-helix transcriptional regulator [Mycobacterium cookii]BBX47884.1 putative HTH-type transcriptional regulator YdfF [Mycobacterium cookii]